MDCATRQIPGCADQVSRPPCGRPALPSSGTRKHRGPEGHCSKRPVLSSRLRPPATRSLRKQLLTLGHTDLVILENAVSPPRESQKKLRWEGGVGEGDSHLNEMQTRTQGLAQLNSLSGLAEAVMMVEKSMSPDQQGAREQVLKEGHTGPKLG